MMPSVRYWLGFAALLCMSPAAVAADDLVFGRFGTVRVSSRSNHAAHVAILVSGVGGWGEAEERVAGWIAGLDVLVLGVDMAHYSRALASSRETCVYPAADFEALSKYAQQKLGYPRYEIPLLCGYSTGAALAYAVLAESPPNTFLAGVSLGFTPSLPIRKPLCRGRGLQVRSEGDGYALLPSESLPSPWYILEAAGSSTRSSASIGAFAGNVPGTTLVAVTGAGRDLASSPACELKIRETLGEIFDRLAPAPPVRPPAVQDLPLVELPAAVSKDTRLAVIITGDGGWAGIDRDVGNYLAAQGIPVVGLNSLQYFWTRRTPAEAARDLQRILVYSLDKYRKKSALLIGYSLGADVLPFMANGLAPELRSRVDAVVMLGPSRTANFEFHISDWLRSGARSDDLPVLPEVEKLKPLKVLCICGEDDDDSLCPVLPQGTAQAILLKGGHHFGGNYREVADLVLRWTK